MNINQSIFTRTAPKKKLDAIHKLTDAELWSVTPDTITRIIKETGYSYKKRSRNKDLRICSDLRAGNGWNSNLESVCLYKGKLSVDLAIMMDHTDTTISGVPFSIFFRHGEYRGKATETNRYGDEEPHYCIYDDDDKVKCMRSILLQYIHTKYADKIKEDAA